MKKIRIKTLRVIIIVGLACISIIGYGVYWALFDTNRLPKGEYLTEVTSPDGAYTLKAYRVNGGATTSFAIRGELVTNDQKGKSKTIYWNDHEDNATVKWIDSDTVHINGHTLNMPNEKFDFRTQ
ncbi:DUF5412 domain-containing protein [Paenibacillus sp. Sa2BVA9]|uniref:DUF5412 domain-containing protein n=1 Tax=Paenibacillus gallinarum TaxID=2762232 RepID=A0ABR8T172_9BACL|nr:DUF5412 domain-containing protein [Paenibacillus gallinarum]